MEGLIRSMKSEVMARCVERIEKGEKIPVPDCSKSLTFRTKNKWI